MSNRGPDERMTAKKTSHTDPDIIEGVAVEKPTTSTGRGRAAGRGKSRSGTGASKQRSADTSADTSAGASGGASGDTSADTSAERVTADNARSDKSPDKSTRKSSDDSSAGGAPARRHRMPAILGATAILLALAGIAVQQWVTAQQETRLRAEIETLAAHLEAANETLADAQAQITAIGASQDGVALRLAGLEAALPQDPAEALAALTARLDTLTAEVAALPAASDAAQPQIGFGLVESGQVESGQVESGLAQVGLGAANAMNAANLDGGDPAQWVPVLREVTRAGLDVGDVDAIAALLTPRPAPTAQLLAEGADLMALIRQERAGDSGWWQNTTGRIAGFIRLRRSDDAPATAETAAQAATPPDAFARALRSGGLAAALAASRAIAPLPAGLADWQAAAQRRLDLDAALAGLMAQMTAHVAAGVAD